MTHQVVLTWKDSVDGGTVNVYRGTAAGTETSTPLNPTPIAAGVQTFTDTAPVLGLNSYIVKALVGGVQSKPSNEDTIEIGPAAPTALTIDSSQSA